MEIDHRAMRLEDTIRQSLQENEGMAYYGDKMKRRHSKPDKYKNHRRNAGKKPRWEYHDGE